MTCFVGFPAGRQLELTVEQAQALLEQATAAGTAVITGFYFDCDLGAGGDIRLADGRHLKPDGTLVARTASPTSV